MGKGRKGDLPDNTVQFPGSEKSEEWHMAQADEQCPDDLKDDELKVWKRMAPELSKLGRLKPIFVDVIAEYCRIVAKLAEARKYLDEKDWSYVTTGRHGQQHKSRPEVAQLNDDWRKFRSLVGELGLSPSAERGLQGAQGDLFGPNPYKDFQ